MTVLDGHADRLETTGEHSDGARDVMRVPPFMKRDFRENRVRDADPTLHHGGKRPLGIVELPAEQHASASTDASLPKSSAEVRARIDDGKPGIFGKQSTKSGDHQGVLLRDQNSSSALLRHVPPCVLCRDMHPPASARCPNTPSSESSERRDRRISAPE